MLLDFLYWNWKWYFQVLFWLIIWYLWRVFIHDLNWIQFPSTVKHFLGHKFTFFLKFVVKHELCLGCKIGLFWKFYLWVINTQGFILIKTDYRYRNYSNAYIFDNIVFTQILLSFVVSSNDSVDVCSGENDLVVFVVAFCFCTTVVESSVQSSSNLE